MGVPHRLVLIIRDYLSNRSFRYRVEGSLSSPHPIRAGVPQGSVLSPILFTLFTSDIPKHRLVQTALFADDTAIYCSGIDPSSVARKLQTAANALGAWFRKWRIEVNPEKSQAVLFHRRQLRLYPLEKTPQIRMFGTPIPWARQAKYLGIILDDRLTFGPHIKAVRNRAAFVLGRLHSLVNSKSKLSLKNKVRLYTSCIRPIMTYGSVVFAHARQHRIHRLQTLQNNFMRRATGAPWYVRNVDLHIDLELPTIRQFIKQCSLSYFDSAPTHPNPLVVAAVNYTPSKISRTRRPKHALVEPDDTITLAQQRVYTARAATTNRPRFRPRRRGRNTRRVNS
ncbi:unnamed protein product [Arctia plantaginis]|uniref:Reverse transcriptase domain-containing protein n=1 Tax=Arctia plantaginis TaxID=874455 RepID=A0A8S1BQ11_ARCPL|nr:unnamed protein product [Arctia plantaginis]